MEKKQRIAVIGPNPIQSIDWIGLSNSESSTSRSGSVTITIEGSTDGATTCLVWTYLDTWDMWLY